LRSVFQKFIIGLWLRGKSLSTKRPEALDKQKEVHKGQDDVDVIR
jgi:hypothetical protein